MHYNINHYNTKVNKKRAMNEEVLKIVLNDKSFSKDESISIVGGLRRFTELCAKGRIRYSKASSAQNGRWKCNAFDVLKNASLN